MQRERKKNPDLPTCCNYPKFSDTCTPYHTVNKNLLKSVLLYAIDVFKFKLLASYQTVLTLIKLPLKSSLIGINAVCLDITANI